MVVRGHVKNGVVVPDPPNSLPEGAEVRVEVVERPSPVQQGAQRQGGWWKGQVHIADDFDQLPDDIAYAFGMREA
jgi:hypothetical protein